MQKKKIRHSVGNLVPEKIDLAAGLVLVPEIFLVSGLAPGLIFSSQVSSRVKSKFLSFYELKLFLNCPSGQILGKISLLGHRKATFLRKFYLKSSLKALILGPFRSWQFNDLVFLVPEKDQSSS